MKKMLSSVCLTLMIVGVGAALFLWSTSWIMEEVQDGVESSEEIVSTENTVNEEEITLVVEIPEGGDEEEERQKLQEALAEMKRQYEELSIATAEFVYYGQSVSIRDDMVEKETAMEKGQKIMDFVFDYVDKTVLTPYGIDKTAYTYDIQRQDIENKGQYYGVYLKKGGNIECTIGVCLDNGIEMDAFARDGLIDLYGGSQNPIPEEYLVENWCNDSQKKEEIYDTYYESSKEIIENVLGLKPIDDSFRDVSKDNCFYADDQWSRVVFGYRLEDRTEIRIFYNRVNQMWDGFYIE